MKTILVLAANPKDTSRLRLDQELREIDEGLQRAERRDDFNLEQQWAVRPSDVRRAMLDHNPNIVHFCGHGEGGNGIVFENERGNAKLVEAEALAGLFELFADSVECVLLNACYSEIQAKSIVKHINYVIGMKNEVGDAAAIEFSTAFYDALGAGKSYEFAFKLGRNAIQFSGIPEHLTPNLTTKSSRNVNHDPSRISVDERELDDFSSFSSGRKRTGVNVHIYWHNRGLSSDDADSLKKKLEENGIPVTVMQHRDNNPPDSIFIGALVSAQEAKIALSVIPYQIQYIFPSDYPRGLGGDPNGLLIGIGYISTHPSNSEMREAIPVKISKSDIASLTETGISNLEFQRRLRRITLPS